METALRGCHHISVVASVVESSELIEADENVRPDVCVINSSLRTGKIQGFAWRANFTPIFGTPPSFCCWSFLSETGRGGFSIRGARSFFPR
jgi:hypothetical protein